MVDYVNANWQDREWGDAYDLLLTDPPFSDRTDKGMECTRSDGRRAVKASYDPITKIDAENLAEHFESRVAHWAVIFCDHISYEWHMRAWRSWGWYVFAPIPFVKTNGAPRFRADGPASVTEWIMVARPRGAVFDKRSRRGYYLGSTEKADREDRRAVGHKPAWLLRQLLMDYSRPNWWIADPYAGTATVGAAAFSSGRHYEGTEIDAETFAKGQRRLAAARLQPDLFPDGEDRHATQSNLFAVEPSDEGETT